MKKINKILGGLVAAGIFALLIASAVHAGQVPHTSYGYVSGGSNSTPWKFYVVNRPTEVLTGSLIGNGPYAYQASVGNLATTFNAGEDSVAIIWKEDNAGIINHAGYYAAMNENLLLATPQRYADCTLRTIPVPTATAGAGKVDLSWSAATQDTYENPPTQTGSNGNTPGANITGYNVYRGTDGINFPTKVNGSPVNGTTHSDTSGTPNQKYYYAIEIVYKGGVVAGSGTPILSANSNQITFPAAPSKGTLQFSTATYTVGENGATATITVTRTGGSSGAVGVSYATSNGTATAGSDYTAASGPLSWADGNTDSMTFSVPITNDSLDEDNETVNLAVTTPTGGASLGNQSTAVLTITDDDNQPTVQFSLPSSSGSESTTPANLAVSLSAASSKTITVNYAVSGGTATSPADFSLPNGTLTFNAGETAKNISITIVDDAVEEAAETIIVALSSPNNATLGTQTSHTYTINANDVPAAGLPENFESYTGTITGGTPLRDDKSGPWGDFADSGPAAVLNGKIELNTNPANAYNSNQSLQLNALWSKDPQLTAGATYMGAYKAFNSMDVSANNLLTLYTKTSLAGTKAKMKIRISTNSTGAYPQSTEWDYNNEFTLGTSFAPYQVVLKEANFTKAVDASGNATFSETLKKLTGISITLNRNGEIQDEKVYVDNVALASDTTKPANPTGLTASAGNAVVNLNWDDNSESDLAGYNVYRKETGGQYTKINTSLVLKSEYTDNTVKNGTTYYYVVTALDTIPNESGYSNEISAMPKVEDSLTITAPKAGDKWVSDTTNTIKWTTTGTVANVKIEYSTNDGVDYNLITASVPNQGTHDWATPHVATTKAKIRISDAGDGTPSATSDNFTIELPPAPSITSIEWDETDGTPQTPENENLLNKNHVYGTIEIKGNFFDAPVQGNRSNANFNVKIDGKMLSEKIDVGGKSGTQIYYWDNTTITCGVPIKGDGANDYITAGDLVVHVTANGLTDTNNKTIEVKPKVYDVSPSTGQTKTAVTIAGTGFGKNTSPTVTFATKTGSVTEVNYGINADGSIKNWIGATVPDPLPAGNAAVLVTLNNKSSNSLYDYDRDKNGQLDDPVTFNVTETPQPTVTGISPSSGTQGETNKDVTITGQETNWSGDLTNKVYFKLNGVKDDKITINSATAATTTSIAAKISIAKDAALSGTRIVHVDGIEGGSFTVTQKLDAPTGLSASEITQNSAKLSWNAVAGADYYTVKYADGLNSATTTNIKNTYLNVSELKAKTKYTWQVKANANSGAESAYTDVSTFETLAGKPSITSVYNKKEGASAKWVYVTEYDPNWTGTPEESLNLIVEGGNLGENSTDYKKTDNQSAPAGSSIAVKAYNSDKFVDILDADTPDRMYWWQKDKIEIAIHNKLGGSMIAAGAAKVKVTTPGGSAEESFAIKPRLYGISSPAKVGETIKITGTAFGTSVDNIKVKFNSVEAKPSKAENVALEVTVPADAATGNVTVVVNGEESNVLAFTVTDSPALSVEPTTLIFAAVENSGTPEPQNITITNSGKGMLKWAVSKKEKWLSLSPESGETNANNESYVTVSVNPTGLAAGKYTDTISITSSNDGSKDVPVTLEIIAQAQNTPVISSITPSASPAGSRITVKGEKFGATQSQSRLTFENLLTHATYTADIISWSDNAIEAIVPKLATVGDYELRVIRVAISANVMTALESSPAKASITASAAVDVVTIYANPFNAGKETVTLLVTNTGGATNLGYYIYDLTARLVYKTVTSTAQITWNGYDLNNMLVGDGAYLVRVINEDTRTLLAKGKLLVVKK